MYSSDGDSVINRCQSGKERAVTDQLSHEDCPHLCICRLSILRINKRVRAAFLFLLSNTSRSNRIPKMLSNSLVALSLLSSAVSAETVLGVYMFHRHGDRTPKALAPANLTDLGYSQVFTSGDYYRSRYVDSEADHKILGMNSDIVKQSQIAASSPADTGTLISPRRN
jgi:hypothetical protein